MRWVKVADHNITEGEVIRMQVKSPVRPHEAFDGFIYGRATAGFGMSGKSHGRAIMVENEAWTLDECVNRTSIDKARWDRGPRIQVQKLAKGEKHLGEA